MQQQELARIRASASRRLIGVSALMGLGVLLLYVAITKPPAGMFWQIFLIVFGVGALWGAQIMWRATGLELILTEEHLIDTSGEVLARMDNIDRIDRSAFAMKPSNGFLITLKKPGSRVWRPGLWWRLGRRVAIGGVTSAGQTKPVADIMALRLAGVTELDMGRGADSSPDTTPDKD